MADDTVVKAEGLVQFVLRCGGYRGEISAQVLPNMNKSMILGILWLSKENPHIDWTEIVVVINKDHQWILLPFAKPRQQNPVYFTKEISANQINHMLKRNQMDPAFLGDYPIGQRGIRGDGCTRGVHDYAEAKIGLCISIIYPCGPTEIWWCLSWRPPTYNSSSAWGTWIQDWSGRWGAPNLSPIVQDEPTRAGRGQKVNWEHARAWLH